MGPDPSQTPSSAEDLFAEHLERLETGEPSDLAALCAAHPQHAGALRRMDLRWAAMTQAFTALSQGGGATAVRAVSPSVEQVMTRLRTGAPRTQRYALGPEIARGAMGRVVSAWDADLRREVALKFHRDRGGDTRLQRRFLEEAQIAGQLDHPGIVPIHELGLDADGQPFFAMRLVRGEDLGVVLAHVRERLPEWTPTRVLSVLLRVCEAMAYAHAKGVVHRDLKPANIMVGAFGEVYVMDWGLARVAGADPDAPSLREAIAAEDAQSPLLTQAGDVVGTPSYLAPELAQEGVRAAVTPAADVYSLGAILHHLCAGRPPYVREGEQPGAAEVLARLRAGPPPALPGQVPPELRAIHDRAMARDPAARYPNMLALAEDLRAYLDLRVVRAYATGPWAELRKWVSRNRALTVAILAAGLLLVVGTVVSTRQWMRADATAARLDLQLDRSEFQNARLSLGLDDAAAAADLLWRQHLRGRMPRATAWALAELHARSPGLVTRVAPTGGDNPIGVIARTGEVVIGGDDGLLYVLDGADLGQRRVLGAAGAGVQAVAVAPDGDLVYVGARDGVLSLIDAATGTVLQRIQAHPRDLRGLALAADGRGFATGGGDGQVCYFADRHAAPVVLATHRGAPVWSLRFDRDGRRLASGASDGSVRVVDMVGRGVIELLLGNQEVLALSFAPNGDELWVGGATHHIYAVSLAPVKLLRVIPTRNGSCRALHHEADGAVLAAGWWRLERLTPDGSGRETIALRGAWQFSVDDRQRRVVAASRSDGVSVIDLSGGERRTILAERVALAGDGRTFAISRPGGLVVQAVEQPVAATGAWIQDTGWVALDDNGTRLALRPYRSHMLQVYEVRSRRLLFETDGPEEIPFDESFAFSPDGAELAVVAGSRLLRRLDAATGSVRAEHELGRSPILRVCYAQGSAALLVVSRRDDAVHLIDRATNAVRAVDVGQNSSAAALSPDGRTLIAGSWQGVIRIVDLGTGARREIRAHAGTTFALAFARHDPGLLLSSGGAGGITFWDLDHDVACLSMLRDDAPVYQLALSADGRTLAARSNQHAMLIDLDYHQRHIAGNLAHRLGREDPAGLDPARVAGLRAWSAEVLARPWPRFR